MTTFAAIVSRRAELDLDRARHRAEMAAFEAGYKSEMDKLGEQESLLLGGFDAGRVDRARKLILVQGHVTAAQSGYGGNSDRRNLPERMNALLDAKNDLVRGAEAMKSQYFGVKNYSSFGDQRFDCEYGMGPKHGSIVFSIGFTQEARDFVKTGGDLTSDQIEDALYLLSALPQIEKTVTSKAA